MKASCLAAIVLRVPISIPISGVELFRQFIQSNLGSLSSLGLLSNDDKLRFFGFLESPPTLLINGTDATLDGLKEAWKNRILKAPENCKILTFGKLFTVSNPILSKIFWAKTRQMITSWSHVQIKYHPSKILRTEFLEIKLTLYFLVNFWKILFWNFQNLIWSDVKNFVFLFEIRVKLSKISKINNLFRFGTSFNILIIPDILR